MLLKQRDRQPEWMDQPGLDPELHHAALVGLARVNRISGVAGSLWQVIRQVVRNRPHEHSRPLRVLDVASGGGDVAIGVKRRADSAGVPLEITGCDLSETATAFARERAKRLRVEVDLICRDVLRETFPGGFDVVYSSLFLHHLDEREAVDVLRSMRRAAQSAVIVSDLVRSPLGYVLAKWGLRLLTSSPVCHVDGPLSVRAAWTIPEARQLAEAAGWTDVRMRRCQPERFLMIGEGCEASECSPSSSRH